MADDRAGHPPFEDWLNADEPPRFIDALDVELVVISLASSEPDEVDSHLAALARATPPITFSFERDDGIELRYTRGLHPDDRRIVYHLRDAAA